MLIFINTVGDGLSIDACEDENDLMDRIAAEHSADDAAIMLTDGTFTEWKSTTELISILGCLFVDDVDNVNVADLEAFIRAGLSGLPVWTGFMTALVNEFSRDGGEPPAPVSFAFGDHVVSLVREPGLLRTELRSGGTVVSRVGYVPSPELINWFYAVGPESLAA